MEAKCAHLSINKLYLINYRYIAKIIILEIFIRHLRIKIFANYGIFSYTRLHNMASSTLN